MGDLTRNFSKHEFDCFCGRKECDAPPISMELVHRAQVVRDWYGPMTVTSGTRCKYWNDKIGGTEDSAHLYGEAADFDVKINFARYEFLRWALSVFTRVGIYPEHIHLDVSQSKLPFRVWLGTY